MSQPEPPYKVAKELGARGVRRLEEPKLPPPRQFRALLQRLEPSMLEALGDHYEAVFEFKYGSGGGRSGPSVQLSGHSDPTGEQAIDLASLTLQRAARMVTEACALVMGADTTLGGLADYVGRYSRTVEGHRRARGPRLPGNRA